MIKLMRYYIHYIKSGSLIGIKPIGGFSVY